MYRGAIGRVLVTGGAGFIGRHIVAALIARGDDVRVLDNFATGRRDRFGDEVEMIEGDIRNLDDVLGAMAGSDVVCHQAALPSVQRSLQQPLATSVTNVTGTLNVLLAARDLGVRRVVLASSSSVYGANDAPLPRREDARAEPISPYAVSKLAAEQYAHSFHSVYGLETVALRYFNVFGAGQRPSSPYAAAVPSFANDLLTSRAPVIFGSGEQSRDFTHVDDVVQATLSALNAPRAPGRVYNVAFGRQVTINELVAEIADLIGVPCRPRYLPSRTGEVDHALADISQARADLDFAPAVDLRTGLRRTIEHLRAQLTLVGSAPESV